MSDTNAIRAALKQAERVIGDVYEFRLELDELDHAVLTNGDRPFNVMDYYGMEDALAELRALLALLDGAEVWAVAEREEDSLMLGRSARPDVERVLVIDLPEETP